MKTALAGFMVLTVAAGCVQLGPSGPPTSLHEGGILMLHVQNNQWPDMDIYVDGGIGAPQPVGIVRGKSERYFELSKALFEGADEVRLIAEPFGTTQQVVSDPLKVSHHSARWHLNSTGSSRLISR